MACIHGLMTSLPPLNNGISSGMILVGLETDDNGRGSSATAADINGMASWASKEPSGDPVGRGLG